MSIQEISSNFKRFLENRDALTAVLLILVAGGSFLLGKASVSRELPVHIEAVEAPALVSEGREVTISEAPLQAAAEGETVPTAHEGGYVGSKNGTKYHLPWCSGAQRILEENKVWFRTKAEAEAAGYTPASNCRGI